MKFYLGGASLALAVCFSGACTETKTAENDSKSPSAGQGANAPEEDFEQPSESGNDTNNDTVTNPGTSGIGTLAITNELADAYPQGLAVASFSNEIDTDAAAVGTLAISYDSASLRMTAPAPSFGLMGGGDMMMCQENPPPPDNSLGDGVADKALRASSRKLEAFSEAISGKSDECLTDSTLEAMRVVLHITQFENLDAGSGCFMPDWGVLTEDHKSGDLCLVGTARSAVNEASAYIDMATGLVATMLCQGKADGIITEKLSPDSDVLDLSASTRKAAQRDSKISITSAQIQRLADDGSRPVYRTDVTLTKDGTEFEVHLVNSPEEEGAIAGNGTLWISHPMQVGMANMNKGVSLRFAKTVEDEDRLRLEFEMRMGNFNSQLEIFDDEGMVDFNSAADFSQSPGHNSYGSFTSPGNQYGFTKDNDAVARMKYVTWDGYPQYNLGKLAYWVNFGGRYTETARGFVFDIALEDGVMKGCGVAGATSAGGLESEGISIRRSIKEELSMEAKGHLRPFACGDKRSGPEVWKQCFVQNDQGSFVADPTKMQNAENGILFVDSGIAGIIVPRTNRAFEYKPPLESIKRPLLQQ